ncbi:MAG: ferredoxin [Candidatus Omnitrophica bacterium]|nr:ferredoxin [Candidatus Omnitrophota bacterium]
MRAIVDQDACVGCGLCVNMCPDVFSMDGDKAVAISGAIPENLGDSAKDAAGSCPVEAIKIEG